MEQAAAENWLRSVFASPVAKRSERDQVWLVSSGFGSKLEFVRSIISLDSIRPQHGSTALT